MSWKTINAMLGLASVDSTFCQELLSDPLVAAWKRNFDLTEHEKEELCHINSYDLAGFSQAVLRAFNKE